MTDIKKLREWRNKYSDYVHVAYVNSSAEHKALADWTVTSRNVDDIIAHIYKEGQKVIYSPDRNMGAYLNFQYGYNMPLWSAVCEVHDKFNKEELDKLLQNISGDKYVISHPESPLPVLQESNFVGSTSQLLNWVKTYSGDISAVILVATEDGILYNMKMARPELDIRQAPIYTGCKCNSCPYMKLNTVEAVRAAQNGNGGLAIDYLSDEIIERARQPIERMLSFS